MPKLTTLLKILRDGTRKGSVFKQDSEGSSGVLPALRDHYDRLELFCKKRYPKEVRTFLDTETVKLAVSADRDSSLGIIDTITREFITFWLPELEGFLEEDHEDEKGIYEKIALGIEDAVINAANRVDCARNENATRLRGALVNLAVLHLTDLFNSCKSLLDDAEKARYNPSTHTFKEISEPAASSVTLVKDVSKARSGPWKSTIKTNPKPVHISSVTKPVEAISEARLLNSAIAWDVSDHCATTSTSTSPALKSTVKRGFSEAFFDDGPDPADNGAAWDTQQVTKRQKFEIKISKIISVSDSEGVDEDQVTSPGEPRRILKAVSRNGRRSRSTRKSDITSDGAIDAQVDVQVPGALKASDGKLYHYVNVLNNPRYDDVVGSF